MNFSEIVPGFLGLSIHQLRCVSFIAVSSFYVVYYFLLGETEEGI